MELLVGEEEEEKSTIARPFVLHDDDDEAEKSTLARFVPINSEIRGLLDDPEETLAYIRTVQASMPDSDSALDSLVAVYEDRVERIKKERARRVNDVAPPPVAASKSRDAAKATTFRKPRQPTKPLDRALLKVQPHLWKIVYSTICVWGLLQLVLTR
jgi:hypothetical protein